MHDDKLARIRKLLAQAEDAAATPAESEAFNAKAAELMARHGVDAALLAASDPGREVVGDLTVELLAPYAYEKGSPGSAVARGLRCSAVLRQRWTEEGKAYSLHLFGHTTDPVLAEMLLTSLLVPGRRRADAAAGAEGRARCGIPPDPVAGVRLRDQASARGGGGLRREGIGVGLRRGRHLGCAGARRPGVHCGAVRGRRLPAAAHRPTALPVRRRHRRRPRRGPAGGHGAGRPASGHPSGDASVDATTFTSQDFTSKGVM
ncbi:DUF2786 domain-containing protein [Nocardioides sp. B-3]|uniref:DUF2786 domain-containing protein n=1 Tax=Nocardioides sp. B-3 TaxID=2895565 RepID=UPI0021523DBA|nr:DUF2786 domain-containing protein [Nocardioides sp. B-3]UUZ61472.1 DUF2786 domain-containing protein [Nocardioides sp. B-3]